MATSRPRQTPGLEARVYLNHGKWVARCPRPLCANAEQFGRCDDGTTGGLTDDGMFHCRNERSPSGIPYGGCGLTCRAVWPENVAEVEALTRCRPVPASRNFYPDRETLADLQRENFELGIVPEAVMRGETVQIIGNQAPAKALGTTTRLEVES